MADNQVSTDPQIDIISNQKWYNKWREAIGWLFFVIVAFDFLVAPMIHPLISYYFRIPYIPWQPLTLQGGGMFYMAMGPIVGVAAWGKMIENREILSNLPDYSMGMPINQYQQQPTLIPMPSDPDPHTYKRGQPKG